MAPPLDLFRLDLSLGHFILFGQHWTLGLELLQRGEMSIGQALWGLSWRLFLPVLVFVGAGLAIAWRFGRLYCGWLCPHFVVVETINRWMYRASGKPTLWEPASLSGGSQGECFGPRPIYWLVVFVGVAGFAFLWALTLLTYLITPSEVYQQLYHGSLDTSKTSFLLIASGVFAIDFMFARHLFCRYGCAVGLFQSLAWMGNRNALVVGFERHRGKACITCNSACDNICPMRLRPRSPKMRMLTCTQCTGCISACETAQANNPQGPLLHWVQDQQARPELKLTNRIRRPRHP